MPQDRTRSPRRWRYLTLGGLVLLAAVFGAMSGFFLRLDLPDVRALQDYTPPVMSRALDTNGEVVATFAEERRLLIGYEDIPAHFIKALIATEDSNFYRHTGIDFKGIARAAWSDLRHLKLAQGASTLTQQLARNLFLHPDKTIRRKLQEVLLALEIERQYTKEEILRFYSNQVYTGHGRYGLEAAARYYFGKPARELDFPQAATLAGLIQRPEALSPIKNPGRSLERRNHVIERMREEGMLTAVQAAEARETPLEVSAIRRRGNPAPYFVEEVRRWLQREYGSSTLYKEGLEIRTTVDPRLQRIANRAVARGVRELDKRQGWRGVTERVAEGTAPEDHVSERWELGVEVGTITQGVVLRSDAEMAEVRVGPLTGRIEASGVKWTRESRVDRVLRRGDLIEVEVLTVDETGPARLALEQEPVVEASLVALDPSTGKIRAMVGGYDFARSEFNRATQAKRQTGSAFKPLVFAAALAEGWTLADTVIDEPTVFVSRRLPQPYQPENYTNKYYSTVTLRTALERSANIATVKLLQAIGYDPVIDLARRLGISGDLHPFPSLALGAFEVSLLELTAAYGTFANHGVYVQPHLVTEVRNRESVPVERVEPKIREALTRQTAHLINRVLGGVITDGTGRAAKSLGLNLAGKTGTTDDNTDAWFIGYAPGLALGVWVGFDERRSLGDKETGAQAALPIWRGFMEEAFRDRSTPEFESPPEVVLVAVDRRTGKRASGRAGCNPVVSEVFVRGTEPTAYCSGAEHRKLLLPYPFQRYALNDEGALSIPENELHALLDTELDVYVVEGGQRLEAHTADGVVSLALEVLPATAAGPLPSWLVRRYDASKWEGRDGRRAEIVQLR